MSNRDLADVRVRIEKAVARLPGDPVDLVDLYSRYEDISIATLDAEHESWPAGVLAEWLMAFLATKQLELGVNPDYPESE